MIWVFGDSFAHDYGKTDQWMHQVSRALNTTFQSLGVAGSSLEFTYQRFNLARKKIKENDIVIIALTATNRRWFFKNYPGIAATDTSPTGNKKEIKAIELYREHLDNNREIQEVYLTDFLYNVSALTEELNLKVILLPVLYDTEDFLKAKGNQFPLLEVAKGKFVDVIVDEVHPNVLRQNEEWIKECDPRLNHLSKSNHNILANKIVDSIKNNVPVDLTTGFIKHIVTLEKLEDPVFVKDELFDGHNMK